MKDRVFIFEKSYKNFDLYWYPSGKYHVTARHGEQPSLDYLDETKKGGGYRKKSWRSII